MPVRVVVGCLPDCLSLIAATRVGTAHPSRQRALQRSSRAIAEELGRLSSRHRATRWARSAGQQGLAAKRRRGQVDDLSETGTMIARGAQRDLVRYRPLNIEMEGILPRHANTSV